MRKRGDHADGGHGEPWLMTYADMITLLMALFIVMLSVSTIDQQKAEEITAAMKQSVSKRKSQMPFQDMKARIDKIVRENKLERQVTATLTPKGVDIEFASSVFFALGQADLLPEAGPILDKTAIALKGLNIAGVTMNIEGHTDDTPINSPRFASNWELSTARATNVVRYLIDRGVDEKVVQALGLAATRPKLPNRDEAGHVIPNNQAANRRVVIRLVRS
ncbi:MAG: flagellar motor protein MotB [Candidatus Sericytochromatia bacterium]|nr:flagellar motor protein MotB [Candidatus Sericytochromatia bacterium]